MLWENSPYYVSDLYLAEKKYHKKVERNKIRPPENVVTNEVFKPFHKICGAMFEISGTIFKALLIPKPVDMIPKIAVPDPTNMILSMWKAPFKFLNDIKTKIKKEQ